MGTVKKTPHGTYQARWRDGAGNSRARTFKRQADAAAFLRDTLGDLQRGVYVSPTASKVTVAEMADRWLANARNLGDGGRETYRRDLDRYIIPSLGDLPLRGLTPEVIDQMLNEQLEQGLAASTVHRHYRTIRRLCQIAVERRALARNPCENVEPPKIVHREMRFLTVAEVDTLAGTITDRYRALIYVAAYGGLRWSELVGLRRSAVNGARISVTEQLVRRADKEWHRDQPKTLAGRRTVALPPVVVDALELHLEHDGWSQPGSDGLVFVNRRGRALTNQSFAGNVFKPACLRAKLATKDKKTGKIVGAPRIHDLRHTAVALAILAGAHPKAIQVRMGHASISVTLDRYGHLFPEMDDDLAVRLGALRQGVTPAG